MPSHCRLPQIKSIFMLDDSREVFFSVKAPGGFFEGSETKWVFQGVGVNIVHFHA